MNVLIISGETTDRQALQHFLKRQGLKVQSVALLREAIQKVLQVEFDSVLVLEPLEGVSPFRLGQLLRQQDVDAGVLLLTAAATAAHRIEALDAGYDDVLSAPYDLKETYARLKAIARRRNNLYQRELKFGDLVIHPDEFVASINTQRLELTKKEFNILFFLARNPNRVVSKDQLIDYLWGEEAEGADGYDFLYAHLKNLRRKLRALGKTDLIETVYGVGYILRGN
jgi:DNA-binding response OmpR family regulator